MGLPATDDDPRVMYNAPVEDRRARALDDQQLATALEGINRPKAFTPAEKKAIVREAARRLRWGRMAEKA